MSEALNIHRHRRTLLDTALLLLGVGSLVYVFWGPLAHIWETANINDDYSHGLLLPFISLYILWDRREQIISLSKEEPESGISFFRLIFSIFLLIAGGGLYIGWVLSDLTYVGWLGFFMAFTGTLLLCLRKKWLGIIAEPCLLLFMAHPIPGSLVPRLFNPLQHLAARASKVALEGFGVPVYVQGNIIEIPTMKLLVEEACSGLRSVLAMATVGVIMPMLFKMSRTARIVLFCIAICIALLLNIFRVVATGILAHFYDPSVAEGFFHDFTGMVVFIVGISIVYFLLNFFISEEEA